MLGCPCGCVNIEKGTGYAFQHETPKIKVYWAFPVGASTLDKEKDYAFQHGQAQE